MQRTAHRSSLGAAVSLSVHGAVIAALFLLPVRQQARAVVMDLVIESTPKAESKILPKAPNKEPSPVPGAKHASEHGKPKATVKSSVARRPPVPIASPKFDLGADTFAMEGGTWGLEPAKGDSTLGAFVVTKAAADPGDARQSTNAARGHGFEPIPTADLKRRPEPQSDIAAPPYPTEAKRDGIEGAVVLRVEITKEGRVRSARVVQDPGGGLGEAAHAAMLRARWRPALDRNGAPVDTVITYSYRFVLEG